jgi:dihydropteroate synthase
MLGRITGKASVERVHASIAAVLVAVGKGVSVVRVHDVAATRDALAVWLAARDTIGAISPEGDGR